jgi:hypothetical protein
MQSFFGDFLVSEFFNSHAWLRQLRTGITCVESLTGVAKLGRMVFLFYRRQQGLSLENQFGRCLIL